MHATMHSYSSALFVDEVCSVEHVQWDPVMAAPVEMVIDNTGVS